MSTFSMFNIFNYYLMFFNQKVKDVIEKVFNPTHILAFESEGDSIVKKDVIIENVNRPFSMLSFDDFTITKCLKNGVSYKALQIQPDVRLNEQIDADIDAFNAHVLELADSLVKSSNN